MDHFDFILLGSGAANKLISWTLSATQPDKRVAVIERKWVGGACPNVACLPSKNIVYSANAVHIARQAQKYGLSGLPYKSNLGSDGAMDMKVVRARKDAMVQGEVDFHESQFAAPNTELIRGNGTFVGPKTLQVNGRTLTADYVVVDTGSRPLIDDTIPGLVDAKPLTHVELLDIDVLPSHLIILGGGYVGIEFAQAYRRFGSEVTVIERNAQVLNKEDQDVVAALVDVLSQDGITFLTSTSVLGVSGQSGDQVEITTSHPTYGIIRGSHILVATGRAPTTSSIGLEKAGIKVTGRGHIAVNEQLQTSVDGVFAAGDCAGGPYFTHISVDDFRVIHANLTGSPRPGGTRDRQVPSTLFTSPELAHVGLREKEAKAQGIQYGLCKVPMTSFLRTHTHGLSDGFAKALVDVNTNLILGFTAVGSEAGELLPVVQLAMKMKISYKEIASLVFAHPTMNEGLGMLFSADPQVM